jgi:hypothetical protein
MLGWYNILEELYHNLQLEVEMISSEVLTGLGVVSSEKLTISSFAARLRWYPRRISSRLFTSSKASFAAGRQAFK